MKMVNLNVRLPQTLDEALQSIARSRLTNKSAIAREIILDHIRREEEKHGNTRTRTRNS